MGGRCPCSRPVPLLQLWQGPPSPPAAGSPALGLSAAVCPSLPPGPFPTAYKQFTNMLPYLLSSKQTKSLPWPHAASSFPCSLLSKNFSKLLTSHFLLCTCRLGLRPHRSPKLHLPGSQHPALLTLMGTQPWSYQVSQSIWETQALPHGIPPETHLLGHPDSSPALAALSHLLRQPLLLSPASEVRVPGPFGDQHPFSI